MDLGLFRRMFSPKKKPSLPRACRLGVVRLPSVSDEGAATCHVSTHGLWSPSIPHRRCTPLFCYSAGRRIGVSIEFVTSFKNCKRKLVERESYFFYISFIIKCEWKNISGTIYGIFQPGLLKWDTGTPKMG